MNLYVGTSGYSYLAWKGTFYPQKLPAKQMLHYYGEQFNAVESFYAFRGKPDPAAMKAWTAEVPADFKFVLKAPMRVTHIRRLKNVVEPMTEFLGVAGVLKKRLGPLLFQLPPNFKKDVPRLSDFLKLLPAKRRPAFEFRHQSWFDDEVFAVLGKHKAALCIAEAENDLEIPFVATTNWGYLRLRRPDYTDAELTAWLKRVRGQNWRDVFVFFKHEDEAKGPQMAKRLRELAAAN